MSQNYLCSCSERAVGSKLSVPVDAVATPAPQPKATTTSTAKSTTIGPRQRLSATVMELQASIH